MKTFKVSCYHKDGCVTIYDQFAIVVAKTKEEAIEKIKKSEVKFLYSEKEWLVEEVWTAGIDVIYVHQDSDE